MFQINVIRVVLEWTVRQMCISYTNADIICYFIQNVDKIMCCHTCIHASRMQWYM